MALVYRRKGNKTSIKIRFVPVTNMSKESVRKWRKWQQRSLHKKVYGKGGVICMEVSVKEICSIEAISKFAEENLWPGDFNLMTYAGCGNKTPTGVKLICVAKISVREKEDGENVAFTELYRTKNGRNRLSRYWFWISEKNK